MVEDCISCAIKHIGIAEVFLEEAVTRPPTEARERVLKAYHHLSHAGDIHLATKHPLLAAKIRETRKKLEPCILENMCPPPQIQSELDTFQKTLLGLSETPCPTCKITEPKQPEIEVPKEPETLNSEPKSILPLLGLATLLILTVATHGRTSLG